MCTGTLLNLLLTRPFLSDVQVIALAIALWEFAALQAASRGVAASKLGCAQHTGVCSLLGISQVCWCLPQCCLTAISELWTDGFFPSV